MAVRKEIMERLAEAEEINKQLQEVLLGLQQLVREFNQKHTDQLMQSLKDDGAIFQAATQESTDDRNELIRTVITSKRH
jgi:F0F1-type ATP synthase membrane subunit b/b'